MKSLKLKIFMGTLSILLFVLIMNIYTYIKVSNFHNYTETIINHELVMLVNNEKLSQNVSQRTAAVRGYILYQDPVYKKQYDSLSKESSFLLQQLSKSHEMNGMEDIQKLTKLETQFENETNKEVFAGTEPGQKLYENDVLKNKIKPLSDQLTKEYEGVATMSEQQIKQKGADAVKDGMALKQILILMTIIELVGGTITAFIVAGRITKPIKLITNKLKEVKDGDFTGKELKVSGNDEVSELVTGFNTMMKNLQTLIVNIHNTSDNVANASLVLAHNVESSYFNEETISKRLVEASNGTDIQANKVNQNVASLTNINAEIQTIDANTELLINESISTEEICEKGHSSLSKVRLKMDHINQKVEETVTIVNTLEKSSEKIGNISKMITEISTQTNLVALNASIEAARAGDFGKGFAVVAEEVKKLAEQAKQFSEEIHSLIKQIRDEVNRVIISISSNKKEVSAGIQLVENTSVIFDQINDSSKKVGEYIKEVSLSMNSIALNSNSLLESSNEIMVISKEMNSQTNEVASAAQEQLATIEEVSKAAGDLSELAKQLKGNVEHFQI